MVAELGRAVRGKPGGDVVAEGFAGITESACPSTRRKEIFAEACAGITVLEPSPI